MTTSDSQDLVCSTQSAASLPSPKFSTSIRDPLLRDVRCTIETLEAEYWLITKEKLESWQTLCFVRRLLHDKDEPIAQHLPATFQNMKKAIKALKAARVSLVSVQTGTTIFHPEVRRCLNSTLTNFEMDLNKRYSVEVSKGMMETEDNETNLPEEGPAWNPRIKWLSQSEGLETGA